MLRARVKLAAAAPAGRRRTCMTLNDFAGQLHHGLGVSQRLWGFQRPVVDALQERGWCALDGVLSREAVARIRAECTGLYRSGRYSPSYSSVSETGEKIWRPHVHMMELDADSWKAAPTVVIFLSEVMATLPELVNQGLDALPGRHPAISSSIFGHKLAVSTSGGARYPRHLDNVSGGEDKRKLTAVYYFNPGWDVDAQGGAIRMFDSVAPPVYTDIAPVGEDNADRLLLFWSDLLVHEVLPMRTQHTSEVTADEHLRHTFTIWLTTENDACLLDTLSPLYPLRLVHYPNKVEAA
ncbi:hypothetical protein AB1Y20_016930 [Prymnesium parvum]|uniref:Prolyl 4-hydroxylase alpha subunit domain-containing protein n=1 Tax=Prymnesium parvum TaxID=97485 RepID=A0AB34ICI9_PRYPA